MVDRVKINRGNRNRGREYENDAARILGGKRHLANTGGKEDVKHPVLCIQVKGGVSIVRQDPIITGLESAQAASIDNNKLACNVVYNRRSGKPLQKLIIFDLEEFAAWMATLSALTQT